MNTLPIGAAAGAALGPVSSITDALAAGKVQAEKNAWLTTEMIRQQYSGEKEVNRLYRERGTNGCSGSAKQIRNTSGVSGRS